jgi:hypothetical protein
MARYTLKRYNRNVPVVSAGKLVTEWSIGATTIDEAISIAHDLLHDFNPPEDFAILSNERGETVWEGGIT